MPTPKIDPLKPVTITMAPTLAHDVREAVIALALTYEQRAGEMRASHPAKGALLRRAAGLRGLAVELS